MKHFLFLIVIVFVWASSCDKSSSKYCQDMSLSSFSPTTEAVQLEPVTADFLANGGTIKAKISESHSLSVKDFKAETKNKCAQMEWRNTILGAAITLTVSSSDKKKFNTYTVEKNFSN